MLYVSVISSSGKPLMPCHPARARELIKKDKAVRRFNRGIFYIKLINRSEGEIQTIAVGIDPGSKKEGITVKSKYHTYLNIQADAITWVKKHVEVRKQMRRARRFRKTPCRKNRINRSRGGIPPSTKARWQWKLRLCKWLFNLYPIHCFVVEDIKAITKGKRKWDKLFSPLQVGKQWFYAELQSVALVYIKQGWETKELRDNLGLKKTKNKVDECFNTHCVDSWVLANWYTEGHSEPDNVRLLCVTPIQLHRRQLHRLQPSKGGLRGPYGGTRSHGFKRGSLVKHIKFGLTYVGGYLKNKISLHCAKTGKRLTQSAKTDDCVFLSFNSWRTRLLSGLKSEVSAAVNN